MKAFLLKRNILTYFALSFLISWALWLSPVIKGQGIAVPDILLLLGQFALLGPAIAGFILVFSEQGKAGGKALLKSAWNWKFKKVWLLPTLLLPALMIAVTLLIKLPIEGQTLAMESTPMPLPLFAVFLFVAGGPLEEFGWRGYALPRLLKKYSFVTASLILGLLHGLWHLPLHFMDGTVQAAMPIWEFIAVTAVGAVIYSWIYIHTNGNLMLMLMYHWAGNLTSALFAYWHTSLGRWVFFIVQLAVVVLIVVFDTWHKRNDSIE